MPGGRCALKLAKAITIPLPAQLAALIHQHSPTAAPRGPGQELKPGRVLSGTSLGGVRRPTGSRESQEQSPGPRGARDPAPAGPHAADPRPGPGAATGRERTQFEGTGGSPSFRPRVGGVTSNSPHETTSPPLGRHPGASGFLETAPWQRLPCGDVTSHGSGRAPGAGPRAGKLTVACSSESLQKI